MACFLFVSYSGLLGGAERVLLDVASDVDGTALLACPAGPLAQAARAAGLTVVELPVRDLRARGGLRRAGTAAAALAGHALDMRRLQRELDPSLIVAWGMRSGIAALGLPPGSPFGFAHHDFSPRPAVGAVIRRVARRARVVTVPSEAVRLDLDPGRRLGDRIRVISPGVDVERFACLRPPLSEPSVLVLGAVAPWKRPDLGLDVVALARSALPRLTLTIVGAPITEDEPFVQELRERATSPELAPMVTLRGPVADSRLELERAACLLHCAPAEPFGMVIVEALAAGLPVVVPDAAGPREIVDADCAELYCAGDAASAARALIRVLGDPARARAMGRAGRARARARFDVKQTRQKFADALSTAHHSVTLPRRSSPEEVTLVTVSHNSSAELRQLIACRDLYLPGAAMIIVDCASSDQSTEVADGRPDIQMIALDENVGFGRACNLGIREVTTPVTVLVNPDVELVDRSLLALAHEAQRDDRPDRLLAPLVLNPGGTRQPTVHSRPGAAGDLIRSIVPPALLPALAPWRARRPRRVAWAVGAALVARTTTLRRLGPFDESIFMYGEDMELGLRASASGISTWFVPSARVLHAGAHSSHPAFGGEAFERLARARQETVLKRLGRRRARLDRAVQMTTFASRILYKTALGRPASRERHQFAAARSLGRFPP